MIGRKFEHYRITEYLGGGGMGAVYKAEDAHLQRPVALKFLHESWVSEPDAVTRFEREARTASALNHPNICVIHDFGESEGRHFIVMEWLDGWTLESHLQSKELRVDEILQWSIDLASAVDYAHSHGIMHRDLKPANIFVTHSHQLKILDFGLAKPIATELSLTRAAGGSSVQTNLTNPGAALGTVGYMSPEQARGEAIDGRSDVFSLGAVMYEMGARRRAFAGETNALVYDSILNRTPSRVREFNPNVPAELDDIIVKRALEKDSALRYQTAADLTADLKRFKRDHDRGETESGTPLAAPPPARPLSRRQFVYLFAGGAAFGLVGAGVYGFLTADSEITSIVVLPFTNTVGDEATGYLAAGITESVRNNLSELPLFVYPRVTAARFEGPTPDLEVIRDELNADSILTGIVSQRAEGFSVQVDLIDVRTGENVWGGNYPFFDPLSVQNSIADDIAVNLRVRLSGQDLEQVEVARLMRDARYRWENRNETELLQAIDLYQEVIVRDPENTEAYAGLALVEAVLPIYSQVDPAEYARRARQSAVMSRRFGELADAHSALALVAVNYDRDWATADREYRRAIELEPDNATAHQWRAEYLTAIGDFEGALFELDEAARAEPGSLVVASVRGWVLYCAGRFPEAVEQLERILRRSPNYGLAYRFLGQALIQTGDHQEALEALQTARQLGAGRTSDIAYVHARLGNEQDALEILEELRGQNASPYEYAIAYTGLGEMDRAFSALEQGLTERPWELVNLNVEPMFDSLRSHPRFAQIVQGLEL